MNLLELRSILRKEKLGQQFPSCFLVVHEKIHQHFLSMFCGLLPTLIFPKVGLVKRLEIEAHISTDFKLYIKIIFTFIGYPRYAAIKVMKG